MKQKKIKKRLNKYLRRYFADDLDKVIATRALNDEDSGIEIFVSAGSKIVRVITQFDPTEDSKKKALEGVSKIVEQMDADAVMTVAEAWVSFDSNSGRPSEDPNHRDAILVHYCDHNGNEISAIAILDENRGVEKVEYSYGPYIGRFSNFFGTAYVIKSPNVQEFIADCGGVIKEKLLSDLDISEVKINISDEVKEMQGEADLLVKFYCSERKKNAFMNICPITMSCSTSMTRDAVH